MNIIIIGCGKVGAAVAQQLCEDGHDITIIDTKLDVITRMTNLTDVRGICGNGASYSIQKEAGIETADLMIALTGEDEVNLLSCLVAKKAGDCQTIARVRNPVYHTEINYIQEELGLSLALNPELAAARETARLLRFPSAISINTFSQGRIELLQFRLPANSPICNRHIKDISEFSLCETLACIIERDNRIIIPDGFAKLFPNDLISIVASPSNASRFFRLINIQTNQVKNTMIIGGGKISFYLAQLLLDMGIRVKLIEKNREKCEELCELLPGATIIHGDGTDQELLHEEGIGNAEGFVAFTGIDEENVMLSLYAQSVSNAKMITKVSNTTYDSIINALDIGSVIYPKDLTTEYILQHVRAMQNSIGSSVETLYLLADGRAEALEFNIRTESKVTNIPFINLNLQPNLRVCAIHRNGKIIIPRGQDCIKVGDSVVIITTNTGLDDITDILK